MAQRTRRDRAFRPATEVIETRLLLSGYVEGDNDPYPPPTSPPPVEPGNGGNPPGGGTTTPGDGTSTGGDTTTPGGGTTPPGDGTPSGGDTITPGGTTTPGAGTTTNGAGGTSPGTSTGSTGYPSFHAVDDAASTTYRTPVGINVFYNDYFLDAWHQIHDYSRFPLTIQSVQGAGHGSVRIVRFGDPDWATNMGWEYLIYTPDRFLGQDSFRYTLADRSGTTSTATVTVDVSPCGVDFSLVGFDASADSPRDSFDGATTPVESPPGIPDYTLDKVRVRWTYAGPGATPGVMETESGPDEVQGVLNTSTRAGDRYQATAKVVGVAIDGLAMAPLDGAQAQAWVAVQPGDPAAVSFEVHEPRVPSDGLSIQWITATIRDAAGNLVADGTPVDWGIDGGATLVEPDAGTVDGRAAVRLRAGIFPGTQAVSLAAGTLRASTNVEGLPLSIGIGITGNILNLGTAETQAVTATLKDADGRDLLAGTPITWYTQKGTIVGDATVGADGKAYATLKAVGGSQVPGFGDVRAFVGSTSGSARFQWIARDSFSANGFVAAPTRRVLAGDATTDGYVPIDQADGTQESYAVYAQSEVTITGKPGAVLDVAIDPSGTGLLGVRVNGSTGPQATVTLNDLGIGTFRIVSRGALPGDRGIVVPVTIQVQQAWWQRLFFGPAPKTTLNVAVQPREVIAKTLDFVGKLGWGAFAGDGNSAAEIAGDIGFSLVPVVGAYTDIRDIGKELVKFWPGGESPNWFTFGFGVVGVVGSFLGPEVDWLPTLGKQMAKVLDASKGIWTTVMDLTKKVEFSKLNELKSLLFKLVDPTNSRLKDLAEGLLVRNADDMTRLDRVVEGLGSNGAGEAADFFTRIKDAANLGEEAAQRVLSTLGELEAAQIALIKSAGDLDQVAEAAGKGLKIEKLRDHAEWLKKIKTDPFAKIEHTTEAYVHEVDKYLIGQGASVRPNLLEWVDGQAGKQADRIIDGVKVEIKEVANVTNLTEKGLTEAVRLQARRAKKQAGDVIIDVSRQQGMTLDFALEGAKKAFRLDAAGELRSIRLIGNGFDRVVRP